MKIHGLLRHMSGQYLSLIMKKSMMMKMMKCRAIVLS